MDALLRVGLTNALLAGLLALAAFLASILLRRRPAVVHALWLLVLLKLVTPPLVRLPLWPAPAPEPEPVTFPFSCPAPLAVADGATAEEPEPPHQTPPPWPWQGILAGVWVAGTGLYLLIVAARLRRLRRLLVALPEARIDLVPLAARLGLRRVPRVLLAPGRVPPMLSAAFGPACLVLPRDLWARLDARQREALLLHELAHLARGDHWVRRLELCALALYWWCPVAWWACAGVRHAEEECCDAWVVWASPESGPAYAGALVETVAFLSGQPRLPIGACGAGPVLTLKRRLAMILSGNTSRRLTKAGLGLVALLALALPLAPVAADPPAPEAKPAVTESEIHRVVAALKSCQECHQVPKGHGAAPAGHGDDTHALIIKLMDDLQKQKADIARTERALREAIAAFEKKASPKKTRAEQRIDELEAQLRKLSDELKALRGKGPAKDAPRSPLDDPRDPAPRPLGGIKAELDALRKAELERARALDAEKAARLKALADEEAMRADRERERALEAAKAARDNALDVERAKRADLESQLKKLIDEVRRLQDELKKKSAAPPTAGRGLAR